MPDSCEIFVSGMESGDESLLTPDYVIQKLLSEYDRQNDRKATSDASGGDLALYS